MRKRFYTLVTLVVLAAMLAGCGSSPQPQQSSKQPQIAVPAAKPADPVTLAITFDQFKTIYNSEMQKRSPNPQLITSGGPAGNGVLAYKVSEYPNVQLVGRYEVADNKLTSILFTFDDAQNSGLITRQNIAAWTSAIVTATCPKLASVDIDAIVSRATSSDAPVRRDGIFYMVNFENKKTPWLQITVRVEK
jgi:hypothetical protein